MEVTIKNYGQITIESGGGSSVDLTEVEQRLKNLVEIKVAAISINDIVNLYSNRTWNDTTETLCITTNPWLSDFSGVTDIVNGREYAGVWYISDGSGVSYYIEGITIPVVYSSDGSIWKFALPGDTINPSYLYDIWTEDKTIGW